MTENERKSMQICADFYAKWREDTIEGDKWDDFAKDVGRMAAELEQMPCPIGQRMMEAVLDAINDLYKNGMKPVKQSYFGE